MEVSDFGYKYLGKIKPKRSTEIASSRIGVGFETLDRDMWNVEHAWPVLEELGVKWARVQTGWAKTEKSPGVYNFNWLDEIVDKLLERGVQPWLSVSYGNKLYTPQAPDDGVGYVPIYTPEERNGWSAYVTALTKHYRDRIKHYEIWNEPDVGFFKPKPDPALYVDLIKLTVSAIKHEQPEAFIIGGALGVAMSPRGLTFTEGCFKNGMGDYIDAITYHGYKYMPEQYGDQEFPAFCHLLNKYKPSLEYWQGETGCPSLNPPPGQKNILALTDMIVSEDIQARWLIRRILLELGYGASLVSYFTMGDFGKYLFDGDLGHTSHKGLLRLDDGSCKPSYYALQGLTSLLHNPVTPANGMSSFRLESCEHESSITRAQAASAYQVNLVRGNVPVQAWWLREEVSPDPEWKSMNLRYWYDADSLQLEHPVLIDPARQEVYELERKINWNTLEFVNVPISNSPMLITDRSVVDIL